MKADVGRQTKGLNPIPGMQVTRNKNVEKVLVWLKDNDN
jgi:hypothetical protein